MEPGHPLDRKLQGRDLLLRHTGEGIVDLVFRHLQRRNRLRLHPVKLPGIIEHRLVAALPDVGNDVDNNLLDRLPRLLVAGKDSCEAGFETGIMYIEKFHDSLPIRY